MVRPHGRLRPGGGRRLNTGSQQRPCRIRRLADDARAGDQVVDTRVAIALAGGAEEEDHDQVVQRAEGVLHGRAGADQEARRIHPERDPVGQRGQDLEDQRTQRGTRDPGRIPVGSRNAQPTDHLAHAGAPESLEHRVVREDHHEGGQHHRHHLRGPCGRHRGQGQQVAEDQQAHGHADDADSKQVQRPRRQADHRRGRHGHRRAERHEPLPQFVVGPESLGRLFLQATQHQAGQIGGDGGPQRPR